MSHFKNFFTSLYLFDISYAGLSLSDKLFMLAGGISIALAIIFKIAAAAAPSPVDNKYRNKFFDLFLTLGIWEVVWFGLRYEDIRFFGSHFAALLGFVIAAIWFIVLVVKMFKAYGSEKQAWEKEQVRLRYLPR